MKKIIVIALILASLVLAGCGPKYDKNVDHDQNNRFKLIMTYSDVYVYEDKDTHIMYYGSTSYNGYIVYSVIYDANGKPATPETFNPQ
jgi:protein involved in sex pheromone biosynthesis